MNTRRVVNGWMPVIAWMLLIFAGSTDALSAEQTSRFLVPFLRWLDPRISVATMVAIHFTLRKLGHLMEYGIFAALLWRALRGTLTSTTNLGIAVLTFVVSAMFAASDEFHQSFVPSRTASPFDVMIDCIGALVAVLLCAMFVRARSSQKVA